MPAKKKVHNGWEKMRQERLASEKTKKLNERMRNYRKARYHALKSQGLCVICGSSMAEDGRIDCRPCRLRRKIVRCNIKA